MAGARARRSTASTGAIASATQKRRRSSYFTNREGVSADQRWKTRGFQIVYGYRFERTHTVIPTTDNDPSPFDIVVNLARLSSAVLLDRRDDPINSRKGTFSSISFDQSALFLGSDLNNRKLLMQQFAFVPLGRLVLASRVQAGLAFGRDPLSITDRFRAGGATSVRGYGEDGLGPRDASTGVPGGGDRLLVLNQEARFPMYRWANGVVFVDAGNISAQGRTVVGIESRLRGWPALRHAGGTDSRRRRLPEQSRDREPKYDGSTSASGTSSRQVHDAMPGLFDRAQDRRDRRSFRRVGREAQERVEVLRRLRAAGADADTRAPRSSARTRSQASARWS